MAKTRTQIEEELNEELGNYSDRQIVAEVLGILTLSQIKKLVKTLKDSY